MIILGYFIILLFASLASGNGIQEVKFAAIIYRHGDRTPVSPYPTDPYRNQSLWPVKFGELTNIGKRQHYKLGQWFRKRYKDLISEQFDPTQIYVRSTDVDRTLMSAQANLAGMYPPLGRAIWNPDLLWQPIPVHTVPEAEDEILATKKKCAAYESEMQKYLSSALYKERLNRYQNLMDYLTAYTGSTVKDYSHIEYIYSTLYIESLYNKTLPDWTRRVYPNKMIEPAGYSFRISTATPRLARLKAGPLLKKITKDMGNVISSQTDQTKYKLTVYSAHDDTIGMVLNALGMFNGLCPPYTATVLIELLYDNTTASHFVRISYRNSTEIVEPHVLNIPYCGSVCPFERFKQLYRNLITVDWKAECDSQFSRLLGVTFYVGIGLIVFTYIAHKLLFARFYRQYTVAPRLPADDQVKQVRLTQL